MRSKILMVLIAVLLAPLAGAFAEEPAPGPAVFAQIVGMPMADTGAAPSCAATSLSPLDGAVAATWCADMNCDRDFECTRICGPYMCGGKCYLDPKCTWKYCHCFYCP